MYYENDFTGATREVTLEGEAFFDVVKQSGNVHLSFILQALILRFWEQPSMLSHILKTKMWKQPFTGDRLKFCDRKILRTNAIQLIPNHKLVLPKQAANEPAKLSEDKRPSVKEIPVGPIITPIDSTKKESERIETAWVYSRLEFRVVRFEEVAKKLERWFNVTIIFADEKAKNLNVYGSFENETVEEVFAALKEAFPINYKINNHEVYVESSQ